MICPVMSQPFESAPYQSKWHSIDCVKEECAWWDKADEQCIIHRLFTVADVLQYFLKDIRDKMPRGQHFVK